MSASPLLCWVLLNTLPYHGVRCSATEKHIGLRLCMLQLTDMEAFPNLEQWQPNTERFQRKTLFPKTPVSEIDGRAMVRRLHESLDELQPSIVCINGWSFGGCIAALTWCLVHGVPAIMMSDSTTQDAPRHWWKEAIKRRLVALSSAGLVAGSLHRDYMIELGASPDRVFMGYDAVDNTHFQTGAEAARRGGDELRQRLGLPSRYFLACSRFAKKKNLLRLLSAYARYIGQAEEEPWSLVMIGDGELRDELAKCRKRLGLEAHVQFPGSRSYRELPAYYGLAGAFVHASTVEQWGLVVNEAMAAGLPVLVSNRCGCAPDLVVPGVNGLQFDPYDIDELARVMTQISGRSCDRLAMARAGRQIVARWSPDRFAEGLAKAAEAARDTPLPMPGVVDRVLLSILRRR